jgi:predicted nucleic acid-binding protein
MELVPRNLRIVLDTNVLVSALNFPHGTLASVSGHK